MHSLNEQFEKRLPLTHGLLRSLRLLGEYKGKEELYGLQSPQVLETLRQAAVIQSTESSNRIEGVTAPARRVRDLMAEKTTPRDRSEQEIAGYRDVLTTIHANHPGMQLTPNLILQLHRDLFRYTDTPGGSWKNAPNRMQRRADGTQTVRFEPIAPHLVESAMSRLHEQLESRLESGEVDPLLLIPGYILDFLCIHPFRDGNGRMARLLTLLLLYQGGYQVGRFISLERIVEQTRESYYDTLHQSSQGWHQGAHPLSPFTEYFLGVLTAAYRQFEERVGMMATARGIKTEMVLEAIESFQGTFSVSELQQQCPNVGIDLIRRILRRQRESGKVECLGRGPAARWRRI